MSQLVTRLSMLSVCAALVTFPAFTPAEAGAKHRHSYKHRHGHHHYTAAWPVGPAQPVAPSYGGNVCPAIGRSFDCKIWPPPYADDPDRKTFRY